MPYCVFVGIAAGYALIAGAAVTYGAPKAAGSGMPEIKACLDLAVKTAPVQHPALARACMRHAPPNVSCTGSNQALAGARSTSTGLQSAWILSINDVCAGAACWWP